jgi:hypothetical protein
MIAKFTRLNAKHLKRILLQVGVQQTTGKGSHVLQKYGKYWINSSRQFKLNCGYMGETRDRRAYDLSKYGVKLHVIGNFYSGGEAVIGHQLVDSSESWFLDEYSSLYNDKQFIHILNEGLCHFVPILRTSVPKKFIEEEANLLHTKTLSHRTTQEMD